ncbi:hypothetical protein [Pseudomonas sp. MWU13-2517]|uniref:hypothetical protein n=1 Tax=Pseudomonas sp. MWU13-2517 TaxID=2929055 RepID=UPI00201059D2|nr:hypothetical protein [Pseudomonas sp. MWU13-2517]
MKSSVVWWRFLSARNFLTALLGVMLIFSSGVVFALERVIPKTSAPGSVLVLSTSDVDPGYGTASFFVSTWDIPEDTLSDTKQLLEIQWRTTYYPQSSREEVKLCYYRPYSSQETCAVIYPNTSGTLSDFNDQAFDHGSRVTIRHSVWGGIPPLAHPAGVDSVTFRYRY